MTTTTNRIEGCEMTLSGVDAYMTVGCRNFGTGYLWKENLPEGWSELPGCSDPMHPNFANYFDPKGSQMVFIPKFWYKYDPETGIPDISAVDKGEGWTLHHAFLHAKFGTMRDKTHASNVDGIAKAVPYYTFDAEGDRYSNNLFYNLKGPISTKPPHNPVGDINGGDNTYAGMIKAVKMTRGERYHLETVYDANMMSMLSLAQGYRAHTTGNFEHCAFADVHPFIPKGNNNNNLGDVNDPELEFVGSGYSQCAFPGSANNLAKISHNGQLNGVYDVNGNMWRTVLGLTNNEGKSNTFLILKDEVHPADINESNFSDEALYQHFDLDDLFENHSGWVSFDLQKAFIHEGKEMEDKRRISAGIPTATSIVEDQS
jgi:hypothetical protein